MSNSFAIFDTTIGTCGIVWNERGVAGVQIHDGTEAATRSRLSRRFADAQEAKPPAHVQQAIDGLVALLRGEKRDLNRVTIDIDELPEFNRKVYAIARTIP
jgi:methylated-DNA-[protein]-cysteine S-methyltransferase